MPEKPLEITIYAIDALQDFISHVDPMGGGSVQHLETPATQSYYAFFSEQMPDTQDTEESYTNFMSLSVALDQIELESATISFDVTDSIREQVKKRALIKGEARELTSEEREEILKMLGK